MEDFEDPINVETLSKVQTIQNHTYTDNNVSNNYACNECRRRKAKCTRELPICSICKRHGRHCLYQRHINTPLTRKHLTEVEELLRIATEIITNRLPDVDLNVELERSRNGELGQIVDHGQGRRQEEPSGLRNLKRQRQESCNHSPELPASDLRRSNHLDSDFYNTYMENLVSPQENTQTAAISDGSPELPLDNPPSNDLDYDWDERHSEVAVSHDGMASLSLLDEKPGYLGLASGATLLNMIQSYTSDPFALIQPLRQSSAVADPQVLPTQTPVDLGREIASHKIAQYISDYFSTYHISYPLVHQGVFMAQYNEIIPRPKTGWTVLMYTVAAIGAFMAATTPNDDDVVLFHLARSHLSVEMLEVGNLTLVQSLTLISNYLQKRDRPNSGYNYLGLAVRMAFGLGLHKEFPNWKGNLLQSEMRRRVWWCLYIFDAGSTITYSRPLSIPTTGIDVKLPLNTFDSELNAGTARYPSNSSTPTIYTNVRVQSKFHLLTTDLYNRIISKPCPSAKEVLVWDDQYIGKWLSLVPEYYKDDVIVPEQHALAHAIMIWRYKNLRMILYRPFLIQKVLLSSRKNLQSDQSSSVSHVSEDSGKSNEKAESSSAIFYNDRACDRCRKESNETIRHIDQYWKTHRHTRMASWYALFFLFPAVLVPLISMRNEPQSHFAKNWREDIGIATQLIKSMMELNPSAARFLKVLEKLSAGFFLDDSEHMQHPNFNDNFTLQPIDDSPITQMLSMRSLMFPDAPLYDLDGQLLYGPGGSSALGMTSDELYAWTDVWDTTYTSNTNG